MVWSKVYLSASPPRARLRQRHGSKECSVTCRIRRYLLPPTLRQLRQGGRQRSSADRSVTSGDGYALTPVKTPTRLVSPHIPGWFSVPEAETLYLLAATGSADRLLGSVTFSVAVRRQSARVCGTRPALSSSIRTTSGSQTRRNSWRTTRRCTIRSHRRCRPSTNNWCFREARPPRRSRRVTLFALALTSSSTCQRRLLLARPDTVWLHLLRRNA